MPNLGAPELVIIAAVVLLLFGAKRLPEMARSLGKAKGQFKKGLDEGDQEPGDPADAGASAENKKN